MASPSSSAGEEERTVRLRSLDGQVFEIEVSVARQSKQIKYMIEDNCTGQIIPVPNVTGNTLAKVIEYFRIHVDETDTEGLKAWDDEYINVDLDTLHDLILAANYLNASGLLDLCCQTVADKIKGKTPQQIRETFNIENDFTPDQEEEISREYAWAFED